MQLRSKDILGFIWEDNFANSDSSRLASKCMSNNFRLHAGIIFVMGDTILERIERGSLPK